MDRTIPETGRPFVKADSVSRSFGDEKVLDGLSFEFTEPGIYVIEGPSGSGKTTLLRIIAGLETCDKGNVSASGKIGYVFQEPRLFENVSLLDNVKLVVPGRSHDMQQGLDANELLTALGLGDAANKPAREASGGMQQRTAICRALYYRPDILLCDEPFSAIDDANAELAASLIDKFAETGICIVATHGESLPFKNVRERIVLGTE